MREPDMYGPAAYGWRISSLEMGHLKALWIVHTPFRDDEWWALITMDLKAEPSVHGTHEFQIHAVQGPIDIDKLEDPRSEYEMRSDPQFPVAFTVSDDDQAKAIAMGAMKFICAGANPGKEDREWWQAAILTGAQAVRTGGLDMPEASV